jgi:protein TonB
VLVGSSSEQIELQGKIAVPLDYVITNGGYITGDGSPKIAVQRIRVSQGVTQGLVLTKVQPVYPDDAKAAKAQGSVVLAVVIGKDGSVEKLHVINSASDLLTQAAIDAAKQWKYRPYILNENPVEVDTQVTVNFTLAGR